MLESIPVTLLVGTVLGFLTGLGVGGGSLLILWLTMVLNIAPGTARSMNLLFFLPAALIACCFRARQGNLVIRHTLPAIISGCIFAAIFSWISTAVDTQVLEKGFGIILIAAGARELFYKKK